MTTEKRVWRIKITVPGAEWQMDDIVVQSIGPPEIVLRVPDGGPQPISFPFSMVWTEDWGNGANRTFAVTGSIDDTREVDS